jgi:SAM-dependent methyltransferase
MALVEVTCPVCQSGRAQFIFAPYDYVYRVSTHRFGVNRCRDCGAGYLSPRPSPAELGQYYTGEFYWISESAIGAPLAPAQLLVQRRSQIAAKLARMVHLNPGRLLDIGTMKGEFLSVARDAGWQVEGVEFSDRVPNLFDVPIRYGEFLDMEFPAASCDCVTMWAVLEHVYEPRAYVAKIATLLKGGGSFIGVVTNFNTVQARFLRSDDFPRHLTLFTKRSLRRLLKEAGLDLVRVWTDQKLFGGPLRGLISYSVKRSLGYTADEAFYEMRSWRDPEAFCCKFRGRPSAAMKWVNRLDNLVLWIPEKALDRARLGFTLGFEARRTAS